MTSKRDELSGDYAHKIWKHLESFKVIEIAYRTGWDARQPEIDQLVLALRKIADPNLRHSEPDKYTELGCVMNIANEALKEAGIE